jgi:hypothetical protein
MQTRSAGAIRAKGGGNAETVGAMQGTLGAVVINQTRVPMGVPQRVINGAGNTVGILTPHATPEKTIQNVENPTSGAKLPAPPIQYPEIIHELGGEMVNVRLVDAKSGAVWTEVGRVVTRHENGTARILLSSTDGAEITAYQLNVKPFIKLEPFEPIDDEATNKVSALPADPQHYWALILKH